MTAANARSGRRRADERGRRDGESRAQPVSRRSVHPMILAALVLLTQPQWVFAEDPFTALNLIKPSPPMAAKNFSVSGLNSRPLRLSDFKDKVRLLNFWATWCLPCKEEMPSMERLFRRYQGRGCTIIAIALGPRDWDGGAAHGAIEALLR